MKILHTADLHLTERHPERWKALEEIIAAGKANKVDVLVISGDLFDKDIEAEKLRVRFREVIATAPFETIILPGNHDYKAYRSGLYFGDKVSIILEWSKPVHLDNASFWGIPYSKITREKFINSLTEMAYQMQPDRFNLLLYHGELLDAFFLRQDLGDEGEQRYMPAKLTNFAPLPVKYVLAGHFHSRYASWQLSEDGLFIYPGSPVSITSRETGKRSVNIVSDNQPPVELTLNTAYYHDLNITLNPFSEVNPLIKVESHLKNLEPEAMVKLTVKGFYNGYEWGLSEVELIEEFNKILKGYEAKEPVYEFQDIQHVMEDELYKIFSEKLSNKGFSEEKKMNVDKMVISAFRGIKI